MRSALLLILLLCLPSVEAQASERDAREAIANAEADVLEMSEAGFGLTFVSAALSDARGAYAAGDYAKVVARSLEIEERRERAFETSDSLRALEFRIRDAGYKGLDASRAGEMLQAARQAFQSENYREAAEFVLLANKELDGIEAEYSLVAARVSAARDNILVTLRERWLSISFGALVLAALAAVVYEVVLAVWTRHRLEDMELQLVALRNLARKAQEQYFYGKAMSRDMYKVRMAKYREMAHEIEEKIPVFRDRLRKFERLGFKPRIPSGPGRPLSPRR